MAQGFATIQRNAVKITWAINLLEKIMRYWGEKQSYNWHKNAVKKVSSEYKKIHQKLSDKRKLTIEDKKKN